MNSPIISLLRVGPVPLVALLLIAGTAKGDPLPTLDSRTISLSPEPIPLRIYSYDLAVEENGDTHIVYSRPTAAADEVVYVRRTGRIWQSGIILSSDGFRDSLSTKIEIDDAGVAHICYVKASTRHLYYRTVTDRSVGEERFVSNGAWHTEMQLDGDGLPLFIREGETWPAKVSKLVLVTTRDGVGFSESFLGLPDVNRYRLGDFVYHGGRYHITYGDSAEERLVLNGKGSTVYVPGLFHNLWHATSTDGVNWRRRLVDDSRTLYEQEFWTSLDVDGQNPIIGMYKYAEVGAQYNTGTSGLIALWDGVEWVRAIIADRGYAETREGPSIAVIVDRPGHYLGVWDYSPDVPQNAYFRGERGNIALARSGADGSWKEKLQVEVFSAEGQVLLDKSGSSLNLLVLGDFVEPKLIYREIDLDYVDREFERIYAFPWKLYLPAVLRGRH